MIIDKNPDMKVCLEAYERGDIQEGRRLLQAFLDEVEASGQDHCTCDEPCKWHGKCKECIIQHRGGDDHLPKCLHNMINERIMALAKLTEGSLKNML